MSEFIIGPFIIWLPKVFLGTAFVLLFFVYAAENFLERKGKARPRFFNKIYRLLPIVLTFFYVFYASIETIAQYYVWSHDSFSKLFLPPHQNLSYFLFYSFGRFWLNIILAITASFVFYFLLKFLRKYRERFFKEGETELGLISALISGWPGIVIFIPLVFVITVILSTIRLTVFKLKTTTLGLPFIFSVAVIFVWSLLSDPISFFHLTVLKI